MRRLVTVIAVASLTGQTPPDRLDGHYYLGRFYTSESQALTRQSWQTFAALSPAQQREHMLAYQQAHRTCQGDPLTTLTGATS